MRTLLLIFIILIVSMSLVNAAYCQDDDSTRQVLKQGLIGTEKAALVPTSPPHNVQVPRKPAGPNQGRKRVIKKYDANGKLVSEEEIYY